MKQRDQFVRKEIRKNLSRKKINIAYVKYNMSGLCTFYNFARNPQQCNM